MTRFVLDKPNAKLMGVCSGLGRTTDLDPTLLRIGAVASLFVLGPLALLAYLLAGWLAPSA